MLNFDNSYVKSLSRVLSVAEASSSPVALWDWEALPDHWLHHQLQQARWFRHCQLCHSKKMRIRQAQQNQLTWGDSGIRSSQPSPVYPEVAHKLGRVVPAQSGVEVQAGRGGLWRGTSTTQPHHVINTQALNQLRGNLQTGYIQELVERRGGGTFHFI